MISFFSFSRCRPPPIITPTYKINTSADTAPYGTDSDCFYFGFVFLNRGHWFFQNVFSSSAKFLPGKPRTHQTPQILRRGVQKTELPPSAWLLEIPSRRTEDSPNPTNTWAGSTKNRNGPLVFFGFLTLAPCFVVFGTNDQL